MNRRLTMSAVLAAFITLALSPHQAEATSVDPVDDGVHIVGDSITYWAHKTVLEDRPPFWTVDAVPGRRVVALENSFVEPTKSYDISTRHMFKVERRSRVRTVVLALGTNSMSRDLTVDEAARMYTSAITRFRKQPIWKSGPKRIVLVTPYTTIQPGDVDANGDPYPPKNLASRAAINAAAIWQVVRAGHDLCVMPWRAEVSKRPDLLYDGIHPGATGTRLWKQLLFAAIRSCG